MTNQGDSGVILRNVEAKIILSLYMLSNRNLYYILKLDSSAS